MTALTPQTPFPCPFCHASRVVLIGGGLVFLHYQCADCAEVWTAMAQPRLTYTTRSTEADPLLQDVVAATPTTKFWLH